jgi:O-antigen ligase
MASGVLGWILAWVLFAFGGAYDWSLLPTIIGIAALTVFVRPSVGRDDWRPLDIVVTCVLLIAAFQLVPLPMGLRHTLSPSAGDFDQRVGLAGVVAPGAASLSLYPGAWLRGFATLAAAALFFWIARDLGGGRSGRRIARAVAWMGLVVAMVVIVQPALGGGLYGFWELQSRLARPAGPMISRNHMGSWLVLALPLTAGCLAAHLRTHWTTRAKRIKVLSDGRAFWLIAAGAMMTAALFVTTSRAAITGFAVAIAFGLACTWRRAGAVGRIGVLGYIGVLVVAAIVWANPDQVATRFDQALSDDAWGGRPAIWQETLQLIRRFWFAGVGVGAFDVVMAAYQTSTHTHLINHAHNEYLNLMAEGGVLMTAPLVLGLVLFVVLAARRLKRDRSPMRHVREGALAGLAGLAVQSMWEVPTLTPAVFFLLATSAGLAVHGSAHDEAES